MIYNIKNNGKNVVVIQPTDQRAVRMNIYEDYTNFNSLKTEIEKGTDPDFSEWILNEEDGGIYSVLYPNNDVEFRFAYFVKINGKNYRCDWDMIHALTREEAEALYKMAKTIKSVSSGQ